MAGRLLPQGQGHLGHRLGVVGPGLGQAADGHVGVADGLDLLQPVSLSQQVEGGEQVVEDLHDPLRGAAVAAPGEVHQVDEEDGDLLEPVGDDRLALLEPGRDRGREDVEQQPLRPILLHRQRAAAAHGLPQQQHRRQQREVGDGAVHQPRGEVVGEVGDGQEDQRGAAEPDHHGQRPGAVARGPGGGQGDRQRHGREQARVGGLVVEEQGRRRGQQHLQGPAPPEQGQAGDHRGERVGGRVRVPALPRPHRDGHRDRHPQGHRQRGVDHRRGDAPQPLPPGRGVHALGAPAGQADPTPAPVGAGPTVTGTRWTALLT